jgi:3-phenylpropionate/cinnamic acid dioxygenase small subunit
MTLGSDGAAAIKDMIRRFVSTVNDERWDDVLALYDPDATLWVAPGPSSASPW